MFPKQACQEFPLSCQKTNQHLQTQSPNQSISEIRYESVRSLQSNNFDVDPEKNDKFSLNINYF